MAILKVSLWIHMQDNGDGSTSARFFNTKKDADFSAEQELKNGNGLTDNVYRQNFEFDEAGVLLNPDRLCQCCGQDIY